MQIGRSGSAFVYLATGILAVAALYFGKPILMPIALATLFAFLLSPLVDSLCRVGLRQSIAVILVVVLMFSLLGGHDLGFWEATDRLGLPVAGLQAEHPGKD